MIGLNTLLTGLLLPWCRDIDFVYHPFALSPQRDSFKIRHVILDTDIGIDVDDMLALVFPGKATEAGP
jgi:hypothetical protein